MMPTVMMKISATTSAAPSSSRRRENALAEAIGPPLQATLVGVIGGGVGAVLLERDPQHGSDAVLCAGGPYWRRSCEVDGGQIPSENERTRCADRWGEGASDRAAVGSHRVR